jgi:hypothetical protein
VGGPIRDGWWAHPKGRLIFRITRAVRDSDQVLVCRAVQGRITFVHKRCWPALVRLAPHLPKARIARITEVHTASGAHVVRTVALEKWVTPAVRTAASRLTEARARKALGSWVPQGRYLASGMRTTFT